jgi:hypothetical protein
MELFLLYAWMKIDGVIIFFHGAIGVIVAVWVFWCFLRLIDMGQGDIPKMGFYKWILGFFLTISILISALMPTSKQLAALVAGHYALRVIESPEVAKIVQLARKKANEYLDEELAEKPAKK